MSFKIYSINFNFAAITEWIGINSYVCALQRFSFIWSDHKPTQLVSGMLTHQI